MDLNSIAQSALILLKDFGLKKIQFLYDDFVFNLKSYLVTFYLSNIVSMSAMSFIAVAVIGGLCTLLCFVMGIAFPNGLYPLLFAVFGTIVVVSLVVLVGAYKKLIPKPKDPIDDILDWHAGFKYVENFLQEYLELQKQVAQEKRVDARIIELEAELAALREKLKNQM